MIFSACITLPSKLLKLQKSVLNIDKKSNKKIEISILEWLKKDHVTLKTLMIAENKALSSQE